MFKLVVKKLWHLAEEQGSTNHACSVYDVYAASAHTDPSPERHPRVKCAPLYSPEVLDNDVLFDLLRLEMWGAKLTARAILPVLNDQTLVASPR